MIRDGRCREAMMSATEGKSASMPAALRPQDISDHFAELAAAHDGDPTMT